MIVELFFRKRELVKKPWQLFFLAIIASSLGILLSLTAFKGAESIVLIVFTIIPLIPVVMDLIKSQEKTLIKEQHLKLKSIFFKHFTYVFLGLIVSYTLWYVALPESVDMRVFDNQIESIYDLSGPYAFATFNPDAELHSCLSLGIDVSDTDLPFDKCEVSDYNKNGVQEVVLSENNEPKFVISENGKVHTFNNFIAKHILTNNFSVFIFILITAFIFGAGSIFIITWNASIIGVFIGDYVKSSVYYMDYPVFAFIYEAPQVFSRLILHGVFEFSGFFCAAIAGSILSLAMIQKHKKNNAKMILVRDSFLMILLGILLLGLGALIESYI